MEDKPKLNVSSVHELSVRLPIENYSVWQLPEFTQREVMHENLDATTQPIYRLGEIEACS